MKIYTRRGDGGDTDLFGGARVGKESRRVEAYGAVDELNALIGACAAASEHEDLRSIGQAVQSLLFELGATLASAPPRSGGGGPQPKLGPGDSAQLEVHIDKLELELPPLKTFILPGGTTAGAAFHVARAVCRRAERRSVDLHREEPVCEDVLRFLNRLSDLLFVMARVENRRAGVDEVAWRGRGR